MYLQSEINSSAYFCWNKPLFSLSNFYILYNYLIYFREYYLEKLVMAFFLWILAIYYSEKYLQCSLILVFATLS